MHKNLYKQQKLGCTWKLTTEKSVWFVKMSTIPCDCCQKRYAKWKVDYRGDPQQWKFCNDCYNEHPVSPKSGRQEKDKIDLHPAPQYFPVSYQN